MLGTFAGKYAFRSTNAQGPVCYLTSYAGESSISPSVSAPALTDAEKVILYAQPDGSYVVVLAVPARFTGKVSLAYLTGQAELGFVTTDPAVANAQELRISPLGAEAGRWAILDSGTGAWTGLAYIPAAGQTMQTLVYLDRAPDPPPTAFCTTLLGVPVTPGHAALVQSKQGQHADLRYTDLRDLDFSGVDFTGANFTGANLTSARFHGATLTGAVFTGATMQGTDVTGATLDGAALAGLDLSSVVWGAGISAAGAHFEGSVLAGCTIGSSGAHANLSGAFFDGADLGGADLTGSNLGSAYFYGANLTGAVLDEADFTQAHFGGSAGNSPAVLSYAIMGNVTLKRANLFGVDFSFATLYGATTQVSAAATAEQADFSGAYLEGISFAGSNLQGARFDGACLLSADFTGAALGASAGNGMPASLAGACLAGAKFGGASVAGTNFANAAISFANGGFPVRYCTAQGPMPPPPATMPINCRATAGLDLTTLQPTTVCPNGRTLAANQARGVGLRAMLTAPGAPTSWTAASCLVPGATV